MKKRKLYALLALMMTILALPYIYGWLIKSKLNESIKLFNQTQLRTIEVTNYKVGWLKSHASTKVKLRSVSADFISYPPNVDEIEFAIDYDIYHGPIIFDRSSNRPKWHFALGKLVSNSIKLLDSKNVSLNHDQLVLSHLIHFNGNLSLDLNSSNVEYKDGAYPITLKGVKGHFDLEKYFSSLKGNLFISEINLYNQNNDIQIENFRLQTDQTLQENSWPGIWLGNTDLYFDNLVEYSKEGLIKLLIKKMDAKSVIEPDGEFLIIKGDCSFESLKIEETAISPLSYSIELSRILPETIYLFNQLVSSDLSNNNLLLLQKGGELVYSFLKPRPKLSIPAFELQTQEGLIKSKLMLEIGGEDASNLLMPQSIINSIEGLLEVELPKKLIKNSFYEKEDTEQLPNNTVTFNHELKQLLDKHCNQSLEVSNKTCQLIFTLKGSELKLNGDLINSKKINSNLTN